MNTLETAPRRDIYKETNLSLISDIVACSALAEQPQRLDPLGANGFFKLLPQLRRAGDINTIRGMTEEYLGPRAERVNLQIFSQEEVKAAQRDLSMAVAASTLISPTHFYTDTDGAQVADADKTVPLAAKQLVRLSEILGVPARPTDATWASKDNPRFFTDEQIELNGVKVRAEAVIKACVGKNWDKREKTAEGLMELTKVEIESPEFAGLAKNSAQDLSPLVSAITVMVSNLTRTDEGRNYFTHGFMPMTMKIKVGENVLIHSGSQFFPVHLADALLGTTDSANSRDVSYRSQNLREATPQQKAQFEQALAFVETKGTLTQQVLAKPEALDAVKGVDEIHSVLAQFRTAHSNAIHATEPLREDGESSGGQLPMAHELKDRTVAQRNTVKDILKETSTEA